MKQAFVLLLAALAGSAALAQEVPATESVVTPVVAPAAAHDAAPDATPAPATPPAPAAVPATTPAAAPVVAPAVTPAVTPALAPPYVPLAGRWDGDFNAAFTFTSGNNNSQSLNLGVDAVYQSPDDKLSLYAQYLETRSRNVSNGVVTTSLTALQWRAGTRYDSNLTPEVFGFVGLDFSQDQLQLLALRSVASTGLGYHLVKTTADQWDVYGGVTYRMDAYDEPGVMISDALQTRMITAETLMGEESSHKLSDTTRFKQKFVLYPSLGSGKGTRATLDAGLMVDINKTFSLSVKLQGRYDSLAEAPVEKYDLLFLTGVSVKFGG